MGDATPRRDHLSDEDDQLAVADEEHTRKHGPRNWQDEPDEVKRRRL
jgi:hypothetical protein